MLHVVGSLSPRHRASGDVNAEQKPTFEVFSIAFHTLCTLGCSFGVLPLIILSENYSYIIHTSTFIIKQHVHQKQSSIQDETFDLRCMKLKAGLRLQ